MHWELLEENSGVFYSDLLDEYFITVDASIAPEEVNRIIRSHALLLPKDVEEDEDACSVLGQHEDTFAGNYVTRSVIVYSNISDKCYRQGLLLLMLVQSTGHEEVNKIIHLPR